jgi:hypothetical protein
VQDRWLPVRYQVELNCRDQLRAHVEMHHTKRKKNRDKNNRNVHERFTVVRNCLCSVDPLTFSRIGIVTIIIIATADKTTPYNDITRS